MEIKDVEKNIIDAKTFISAVVFSGGEPMMQYEALEHLARFAKEQGLLVGIETNGYYPERISKLIKKNLLDKIFLDIKAPLDDTKKYMFITRGKEDSAQRVRESLELKNVDIEVRTTVFRQFSDVGAIARALVGKNCTYVIQQGIPKNAPDKKLQNEKPLTRDEMAALAASVSFLKDVRIRTREKGEEKIN